jgi:hypothetical protein
MNHGLGPPIYVNKLTNHKRGAQPCEYNLTGPRQRMTKILGTGKTRRELEN